MSTHPAPVSRNQGLALTTLKLMCWGFLVFAAIWWTAVHASIDAPASLLIDILDWPRDGSHEVLVRDARVFSAIGAGLMVGFAWLVLAVVIPGVRAGSHRIWRGAVVAITAWYIVDSLGCLIADAAPNAAFNTVFFAMMILPLWIARPAADAVDPLA